MKYLDGTYQGPPLKSSLTLGNDMDMFHAAFLPCYENDLSLGGVFLVVLFFFSTFQSGLQQPPISILTNQAVQHFRFCSAQGVSECRGVQSTCPQLYNYLQLE